MSIKFFEEPRFGNVADFIGGSTGQCFYIPAYKCHLSWSKENVERFYQDIAIGIQQLSSQNGDEEAVSFIGMMVYFHDTKYKTISPIVRPEVPAKVLNIIDGQQRISMLMLTAAVLHGQIRAKRKSIKSEWLQKQSITMEETLKNVFIQEYPEGVGDVPYYPRIIRAFEDQWSKNKDEYKYNSPLSYYISSYYAFQKASGNGEKYKMPNPAGLGTDNHKKETFNQFKTLLRHIKSEIKRAINENMESGGIISDINSVMQGRESEKFLSAIFGVNELPKEAIDTNNAEEVNLFKTLILSSYILRKIHFIYVVVKEDESYAYDIFEALNTTGQTLTAFETFKPVVIQSVGLSKYENSASKLHMDKVDNLLKVLNKENERIKTTSELIIHFALAENGEKITRAMRDQRKYLRDEYNNIPDKENFTRHFMNASELAEEIWKQAGGLAQNPIFSGMDFECNKQIGEADFCLQFLSDANHAIAKPCLIRFYEAIKTCNESDKRQRIMDFCAAVKAVAAFFALWRSSRETTDGIDARHRAIMGQLNRQKEETPSVVFLQKELVRLLEEGGNSAKEIKCLSDWSKMFEDKPPIYRVAKHVAKFVLMVASHNTVPDEKTPGMLKSVLPNVTHPVIESILWKGISYGSLEHIIPQSETRDDACHRLGNLTLSPQGINSVLSNRQWEEKKKIYKLLSVQTDDERKSILQTQDYDFLSDEIKDSLLHKNYALPMLQSLTQISTFDEKVMKQREENIAKLAWKTLAEDWLKI
ncbi:MAG: DUF262 domain-containing HNH endonuclease family protein [Gammaproteobacteria bacterium]